MTYIALALQMGREMKDILHDYWLRLRTDIHCFYGEAMALDRLLHTHCNFCTAQTIHGDLMKAKNITKY
jgi:hypothetical protein